MRSRVLRCPWLWWKVDARGSVKMNSFHVWKATSACLSLSHSLHTDLCERYNKTRPCVAFRCIHQTHSKPTSSVQFGMGFQNRNPGQPQGTVRLGRIIALSGYALDDSHFRFFRITRWAYGKTYLGQRCVILHRKKRVNLALLFINVFLMFPGHLSLVWTYPVSFFTQVRWWNPNHLQTIQSRTLPFLGTHVSYLCLVISCNSFCLICRYSACIKLLFSGYV